MGDVVVDEKPKTKHRAAYQRKFVKREEKVVHVWEKNNLSL